MLRLTLLPEIKTAVVDPPWTPALCAGQPSRVRGLAAPQRHYPTLSLDEIIAIRPPLAKKSHLYIWCLSQHIDWGFELARAWGAKPITTLTWCKPGLGCGRFRCNTEHVVIARRGDPAGNPFGFTGRNGQATRGTYFHWPRGRHSHKPQEMFDLVQTISPGPFLDMYARSAREGWWCWGNEIGLINPEGNSVE